MDKDKATVSELKSHIKQEINILVKESMGAELDLFNREVTEEEKRLRNLHHEICYFMNEYE